MYNLDHKCQFFTIANHGSFHVHIWNSRTCGEKNSLKNHRNPTELFWRLFSSNYFWNSWKLAGVNCNTYYHFLGKCHTFCTDFACFGYNISHFHFTANLIWDRIFYEYLIPTSGFGWELKGNNIKYSSRYWHKIFFFQYCTVLKEISLPFDISFT